MNQPIEQSEIGTEKSLKSAIETLIEISRQFNAGYASLSFHRPDGMILRISISDDAEVQ